MTLITKTQSLYSKQINIKDVKNSSFILINYIYTSWFKNRFLASAKAPAVGLSQVGQPF